MCGAHKGLGPGQGQHSGPNIRFLCSPGEGGLQSLLGNMSHSQLMQLIGPAGLGGLGKARWPRLHGVPLLTDPGFPLCSSYQALRHVSVFLVLLLWKVLCWVGSGTWSSVCMCSSPEVHTDVTAT